MGTTRIIDMTEQDLMKIIQEVVSSNNLIIYQHIDSKLNNEKKPEELTGIEGLAKALRCSKATAQRLKSDGILEGGYQQIGSKIYISDAKLLRDVAERNLAKRKDARRGRRVNYSIINK